MLAHKDKEVMQHYLAEMLFQPLADKLQVSVEESENKDKTELAAFADTSNDDRNNASPKKDVIELNENDNTQFKITDGKPKSGLVKEEIKTNRLARHTEKAYPAWDNGLPIWAQDKFDCLLFAVAGFEFAVPLVTLGQIYTISEVLTPVIGQPSWFMGMQPTAFGNMRVINTAQFVMPDHFDNAATFQPGYMVSMAQSPWALAVDKVNQPIKLVASDVKWREERSKRPWLAGVLKQQMCLLIDIPALEYGLKDLNSSMTDE